MLGGRVILFSYFVLSAVISASPQDAAALLFDEFSAKCSSQGSFTQRVLAETRSLQRILEKIKEDPECQDIVPLIDSIVPLSQQLPQIEQGVFRDQEEQDIYEHLNFLNLQLTLSTDTSEQLVLANDIAGLRRNLLLRQDEQRTKLRESQAQAVQRILDYTYQLSRFADSNQCFQKHQTLPFQLFGHLVSLAGGFWGPVANNALVIGGRLLQTFFRYLANDSIVKEIKKYKKSTMWMGLSCAMESLEDTYCDIQDQRDLIAIHRSISTAQEIPMEWRGFDLMTKDYNTVKGFLQAVKAGAGASSEDQGEKMSSLKIREAQYLGLKDIVEGKIRDAEKKIRLADTDDAKQTLIKNLVSNLAYEAQGNYGTSVADGDSTRIILWLRIGNAYPAVPSDITLYRWFEDNVNSSDSSFKDIDPVRTKDMGTLRLRLSQIQDAADRQLQIEKQLIISADPARTMMLFSRVQGTQDSPENIMQRMLAYLENLQISWTDHPEYFLSPSAQSDQLLYIQETRASLSAAFLALKNKALPNEKRLESVFESLRLRDDDLYLTNRMSDHVDADLEIKVRGGLLRDKQNYQTIVRISASKLINSLTTSGLITDLQLDLDNAEPLAFENLKNFSETFQEPLLNSFQILTDDWNSAGKVPADVFARNYAKLCTLSLNFPVLSPEIKKKCENMLYGHDEGGPIDYRWDRSPLTVEFATQSPKPFKRRACAFRRYQEERRLLDLYRHRPSPFLEEVVLPRLDGTVAAHRFYRQ